MKKKHFFSEEKKQKTFMSFAGFRHREPPLCGVAIQSQAGVFCRVTPGLLRPSGLAMTRQGRVTPKTGWR
jgi:hypothetical protein